MFEIKSEKQSNSQINWDPQNNVLNIKPKPQKMRGFILQVVNSKEELEQIQAGQATEPKLNIAPVFASDEQAAVDYVSSQGKFVMSVTPLELLELQTSLLYDLAQKQNIEIERKNLFQVNKN